LSNGKFASVTSALLVRKGSAAPSKVRRRRLPRVVSSDGVTKDSPKSHKLVLTLSAKEFEILDQLAEKKHTTRDALARGAMDAYFEWLLSEQGEGAA
jgi:hypothetical protein